MYDIEFFRMYDLNKQIIVIHEDCTFVHEYFYDQIMYRKTNAGFMSVITYYIQS